MNKTSYDQIYFWEHEINPHKLFLYRQSSKFCQSYYIANDTLNNNRLKQGWSVSIENDKNIVIITSDDQIEEIIANSSPNSVHIFSGIHWVRCLTYGIKCAIKYKKRFGILSEPRVFEGIKGWLRLFHSWLTEAHVRKYANFILAIGAHGSKWFRMAGYNKERIFPFAYFIDDLNQGKYPITSKSSNNIKIGFLGRLNKTKGFDLLIDSILSSKNNWQYKIGGYGELAYKIDEVKQLVDKEVSYQGVVSMNEVANFLSDIDILVLPSTTKDDGWGVVVSEALLMGVAVICSQNVGSTICIEKNDNNGYIISELTSHSINDAISSIISDDLLTAQSKNLRRQYALRNLTVSCGFQYLKSILSGESCYWPE